MEIIHLVEHSDLSIRKTCAELDVARSTFYRWYSRYQEEGFDGLMDRQPEPRQFWNRIPAPVSDQIVALALAHPEKSPRQIAWLFTDQQGYFVSESSVYRILKGFDLVQSPVFQMVPAREKFEKPTQRVHELWQTDFTQFKVFNHWGWYYLSSILDDYSRYIIAWRLSSSMGSDDVEETLKMALDKGRAGNGPGAPPAPPALGQRPCLSFQGSGHVSPSQADGSRTRCALSPKAPILLGDPGQNRALAPVDRVLRSSREERCPVGELLLPIRT